MLRRFIQFALIAGLTLSATAQEKEVKQEKPDQEAVFRTTSNLVVIDVFVRDHSGKEITGLKKRTSGSAKMASHKIYPSSNFSNWPLSQCHRHLRKTSRPRRGSCRLPRPLPLRLPSLESPPPLRARFSTRTAA